jgi:hypothetical protein
MKYKHETKLDVGAASPKTMENEIMYGVPKLSIHTAVHVYPGSLVLRKKAI